MFLLGAYITTLLYSIYNLYQYISDREFLSHGNMYHFDILHDDQPPIKK